MNDPHKSAQRSPSRLSLVQSTSTGFDFQGSQGEFLQVTALEEDLIRVRVLPDGKPRLDRTWLVLDRAGEMPREGRNREDLSPFSLPAIESEIEERQITLLTTALKLTIALDKFALRWETAHGDYLPRMSSIERIVLPRRSTDSPQNGQRCRGALLRLWRSLGGVE